MAWFGYGLYTLRCRILQDRALQDYLTGWLKAKAVKSADRRTISAFLYEGIVWFGITGELLCYGDSENKKLTMQIINCYRIRNIHVS